MFPAQNLEKPKENRYFRPQAKDLPGLGGFDRFWGQNVPKNYKNHQNTDFWLQEIDVVFAGKKPPEAAFLGTLINGPEGRLLGRLIWLGCLACFALARLSWSCLAVCLALPCLGRQQAS